ncbi:MAG: hypothetical protein ACLPN1_03850 [Dissulfurispiraceae bacterium]|jgi:hypothetical protein
MNIPAENISYVDLPELSETFADSIQLILFDGQSARIEFCVTRMDEPKPPKPPTARKYPVCRLVLTPEAALQLFNQLQTIVTGMQKQGLIKRIEPEKGTIH